MFKKRMLILMLCLTLLAGLWGCQAEEEQPLPQVVIGYNDYRPFTYTDEDKRPAGIDVELAQEACRRVGYEPVFKQISWHDRDALLAAGEVDCLWSCYSISGREEQYDWVGPYMFSRQVVAVLQDNPIRMLRDLEGRTVAVKSATMPERIFVGQTDARIPEVEAVYCLADMEDVVAALRDGYVDACAGFSATLTELLQNSGVGYRFLDENLIVSDLGVAFLPGSFEELRAALVTALNEMHRDGTTARILRSYGLNSTDTLEGINLAKKEN